MAELGQCRPGDRSLGGHCISYSTAGWRRLNMWSSPAFWRGRTSDSGRRLRILEKSRFGKTYYVRPGDDQVIEDSNIHEAQGITQALCNQLICRRRLSNF